MFNTVKIYFLSISQIINYRKLTKVSRNHEEIKSVQVVSLTDIRFRRLEELNNILDN